MNKKKIIAVIFIILLITVVVFIAIWKDRGIKSTSLQTSTPLSSTNSIKNVDSDVKFIEDEFSAIKNDDFNINDLSDEKLGL